MVDVPMKSQRKIVNTYLEIHNSTAYPKADSHCHGGRSHEIIDKKFHITSKSEGKNTP